MWNCVELFLCPIRRQSVHTFSNYIIYSKCCVSCGLEFIMQTRMDIHVTRCCFSVSLNEYKLLSFNANGYSFKSKKKHHTNFFCIGHPLLQQSRLDAMKYLTRILAGFFIFSPLFYCRVPSDSLIST